MLENLEPAKSEKRCKLGRIIDKLEPKDQQIMLAALADFDKWTNRALTNALNERGIDFTVETLRTHRLNFCGCTKAGN